MYDKSLLKMKGGIKWAVVILFWMVVFIISAEALLRYTGRMDSWGERNGWGYLSPYREQTLHDSWLHLGGTGSKTVSGPEFSHEVSYNKERIRDVDHPIKKPQGKYRMIVLGDSFTEGQGVDFKDTWHQNLQRLLNKNEIDSPFTIIAGGVSGSDPVFEYLLLKEKLVKYEPDLVLVAVNSTDIYDIICRGGTERFQPKDQLKYKSPPDIEQWYIKSHLIRFIFIDILGYNWNGLSKKELANEISLAEKHLLQSVNSMKALGKDMGFQVMVVFHPLYPELQDGHYNFPYTSLEKAMRKEGISIINLMPYFQDRIEMEGSKNQDYFWPIDGHHNERGYALFADAVFEGMAQINLPNH